MIGMWVFCEFKLVEVKGLSGTRITKVSDGFMTLTSYDLNDRCFPLSRETKILSDTAAYWEEGLRDACAIDSADAHRVLVAAWADACRLPADKLQDGIGRIASAAKAIYRPGTRCPRCGVEGGTK